MLKKQLLLLLSVSLLLLLIVGCQSLEKEKPFIFSYSHNTIKTENEDEVHTWLMNAKNDQQSLIHNMGTNDGYEYFYAKGFRDVSVTYQREQRKEEPYSLIKANFKKGNENDELFIEVKYNPLVCCDGILIEDNYSGE
ncbi:hypothetical protein [Metabacillus sp. Hm71]|uniref:hypothetical protein n=1 Tax=Metabacillus sp. Hm71 TaxID=3450743 RepID=UPI003F42D719